MKKFLFVIILLSTFLVVSSTPTSAAICEFSTARQCGSLGGCTQGNQCLYNLEGENFCSPDNTCPTTGIVCGTNSNTIGACGPYAGCRLGERCNYSLSGGARCFPDDFCPTLPPSAPCANNSDSDCTRPVNGAPVGVDVGTACSTAGLTCQPQGGMTDPNKCVCRVAPSPTPSPTITPPVKPTPFPTLPPIESTGQTCESLGKNTIYPPNSSCYAEVKDVQLNIAKYPLTCVKAPEATYKETVTGETPPSEVTVTLTSDLSKATLGFLGPDSNVISSVSPDQIAKKYLFSGLFDRPSYSKESTPRELFRTYWRVLSSQTQANLKAIYLEATNTENTKLNYYYLNSSLQQQEADTKSLYADLPNCLRKFPVCEEYVSRYNSLSKDTKTKYDTLLPFDFNNSRGYLALNGSISKESIPYLYAILSALQGSNGLFGSYTPSWLISSSANPLTFSSSNEISLYPSIIATDLFSSCPVPQKTTSSPAPYTYPEAPSLSQDLTIPLPNPQLISSTDDSCSCEGPDCPYDCGYYSDDQFACVENGCSFTPGEDTYIVTGKATGRHITVFNNPLIDTLNNIIVGTGQPGEFSFYRMLAPSFAQVVEKTIISAPASKVVTANPYTTISNNGSSPIYRENSLGHTAMHLLQNCWFVPSSLQTSPMCGILTNIKTPLTCDDCSTTFPDASSVMSLKAHFVDLAGRWIDGGTPLAAEKFEIVVNSAIAAGVNPIFALSSWLLESGASNYDGVCNKLGGGDMSLTYCNHLLDFGINLDSIASNYSTGQFYFDEQLDHYLGLPGYYKEVCKSEMEASSCPMRNFTAMFFGGHCEPTPETDKYFTAIKNAYMYIAPTETFPCYPIAYP